MRYMHICRPQSQTRPSSTEEMPANRHAKMKNEEANRHYSLRPPRLLYSTRTSRQHLHLDLLHLLRHLVHICIPILRPPNTVLRFLIPSFWSLFLFPLHLVSSTLVHTGTRPLTYLANKREMSQSSSAFSSSSSYNSPPNSNMSRPVIPVILPAARCCVFAFSSASASAAFFSNRVFFQMANVSGVTGVRGGWSLCRCDS